jgi:inosose dehydratase
VNATAGVRLGLAPVNWNNDDIPEWGQLRPYPELAAAAARLGYAGLEAGTGAPEDPVALRALLAGHGLALPGAYRWARLADPATVEAEGAAALAVARRLAQAGAEVLLVAEHWTEERRAVAGRAGEYPELALPDPAMRTLCRALEALARQVRALGLRLAFHPHAGTPVETPDEVERLLRSTDPDLVGLCLDTGHTLYGGGDPVRTARRHGARIGYVHAKDVDRRVLAEIRARGLGLLDGLRRGVFAPAYSTPADRSGVDVDAVGEALRAAGYRGWVIFECDRNPRAGDPDGEALAARPRLAMAFGTG